VTSVLVVGAGAIGGYVAAVLAHHGASVTVAARGRTLAAIGESGLRIEGGPDACAAAVTAVEEPPDDAAFDVILLATKARDTTDAVTLAASAIGTTTPVVVLQNGVGRGAAVSELVGSDVGLDGIVYLEARMDEPGVVTYLSGARRFEIGDPTRPSPERAEPVASLLAGHGLRAVASADPVTAAWRKMVLVCTANAMTGATRTMFGDLVRDGNGRRVATNLLREATAVARAAGARLGPDFPQESIDFLTDIGPALRSSMLHDIERGRPTEIDVLNGEITRLGAELGVPTPSHDVMQLVIGGVSHT
jgi:2-dehydropantoate 2-reductase